MIKDNGDGINLELIQKQVDSDKPKVVRNKFTDTYQFQNLTVQEFKRERFDRYSYMSRVNTISNDEVDIVKVKCKK